MHGTSCGASRGVIWITAATAAAVSLSLPLRQVLLLHPRPPAPAARLSLAIAGSVEAGKRPLQLCSLRQALHGKTRNKRQGFKQLVMRRKTQDKAVTFTVRDGKKRSSLAPTLAPSLATPCPLVCCRTLVVGWREGTSDSRQAVNGQQLTLFLQPS